VNISDYAAWYAALIATFVFLWDIIKWKKSGPQIKATARSGYRSFGDPETEGKRLILVIATNIGDRATTLTAMGFRWYPKKSLWRNKRKGKLFIVRGTGQIPANIKPGDEWSSSIPENGEHPELYSTGCLMVVLSFTHLNKDIHLKVKGSLK